MNLLQIGRPVGIQMLLISAACAAVDKATAEELAEVGRPGPTNTAPMTYMHEGRHYLNVSGGDVDTSASSWRWRFPQE